MKSLKGSKNISTQLSIGIADLAIQMTDGWPDPVGFMIDQFSGQDEFMILLEFLAVLPEELASNKKIMIEVIDWLSHDSLQSFCLRMSLF